MHGWILLESKGWRTRRMQLILGYIASHKEINSSSISKWAKETLSGMKNFGEFSGHLTRSAATAKVNFC